jgi:hypothetical protein
LIFAPTNNLKITLMQSGKADEKSTDLFWRFARSLGSLHPILEFLAECFAISAETVAEEGRQLLRESAGKLQKRGKEKFWPMLKGLNLSLCRMS